MFNRATYLGLLLLTGCGASSGHVNFTNRAPSNVPTHNPPSAFNLVLGSQALATTSSGYRAKIQLSDLSGTKSTTSGGYTAKMRFTTRFR